MPEATSTGPTATADETGWFGRLWAWLQRGERAILVGAVAFQVLVLAGMIAFKTAILFGGNTVLLRVQPVDPRDLFRGDYVILGYAFSRVPPEQVTGLQSPPAGPAGLTVYAVLEPEPDGVHWQAVRFTTKPPSNATFLQGRYTSGNRVEYGIESFFVQEGQGRHYEDAVRDRRLAAKVAVNRRGQAVLRELVIE